MESRAIDSISFFGVRVPRSIVGDVNGEDNLEFERFEASETFVCGGSDFAFASAAVRDAGFTRALLLFGTYWIVRNQSRNSSTLIKRG